MRRSHTQIVLEYATNYPKMRGWEIDSEGTVGYMMGIVNAVMQHRIVPDAVHFDHEPICDSRDYERLLWLRPVFGRQRNCVFYPAEIYSAPVPAADPLLHLIMRRHVEDLAQAISGSDDPLNDMIINDIRRGLPGGTATLEHIASELGLGPRTLQRRLVEAGTSFQQLYDQIRLELAEHYLSQTSLGLTEVAFELGYAEASVFSRAFKRWTGFGPREYRQRHL